MFDLSNQPLVGELITARSVPVGSEIAAPSWAKEAGGDGTNPMGNMRSGPSAQDQGDAGAAVEMTSSTFSSANRSTSAVYSNGI